MSLLRTPHPPPAAQLTLNLEPASSKLKGKEKLGPREGASAVAIGSVCPYRALSGSSCLWPGPHRSPQAWEKGGAGPAVQEAGGDRKAEELEKGGGGHQAGPQSTAVAVPPAPLSEPHPGLAQESLLDSLSLSGPLTLL